MKSFLVTLLILLFACFQLHSQTIAEKLGHEKDAKLLMVHADDLGSARSVNLASIAGLENGSISSGSVMVPCPWFADIARYAAEHDGMHDLGIHLTVTCEWDFYKWGPTTRESVPSLVDSNGYFYQDCASFAANLNMQELEIELRAQIDKALSYGFNPTHLDTHMGCLFYTKPEVMGLYLALGKEYGIPVFVAKQAVALAPDLLAPYVTMEDVIWDAVHSAGTEDFDQDMEAYYRKTLREIQPGLSMIIIHPGFDNQELQGVCEGYPYWGSRWRQIDADFFSGIICRKILAEENIKLVTWKEVAEAIK